MSAVGRERIKAGTVAVVFLLVGGFICFEALLVPVGTVRMPGAGFFPLVLGVALIVLSLVLLGTSLWSAGAPTRVWPARPEVPYLAGGIVGAIWLFDRAGFVLTMALFLTVTVRTLGGVSWPMVATAAVVGSVGSYLVFARLLQIALPSGILPF